MRVLGSNERHSPSMGWLWLGLALGAWPLEPVERRMGSPHCAPNHYYGGWGAYGARQGLY